ncbi:MAG: hypothetical protein ABWK05_05855 [Pyrobaculum sp.]
MVLAKQNAKKILELNYAYLLVSNRVSHQGGTRDLLSNRELGRLYLGLA